MLFRSFLLVCLTFFCGSLLHSEPITPAKKYIEYLKTMPDFPKFSPPNTVIMVYSSPILKNILSTRSYEQGTGFLKELYLIEDGKVGIFCVAGRGAPAVIHKIEELIAFGVKKFISVGYSAAFTDELSVGDFVTYPKALSEDGVGHLYLKKGESFAYANQTFQNDWAYFIQTKHPEIEFKNAVSWSFPIVFMETTEDLKRVAKLGCNTAETEIAAFLAIAQYRKVQALALYLVGDSIVGGEWKPLLHDPKAKEHITLIAELAIEFSK